MVERTELAPDLQGYLACPAGVVVVQEWWGLVPHVEDVTRRFARAGYAAVAPDLYHGRSTVDAEEASHLLEGLDWGRAMAEIAQAVTYLRTVRGCPRVGVVGFCMGGALATIAAAKAGADAAVAFYGFPPDRGELGEGRCAPALLFFGEREDYFDVPGARAWVEGQRALGADSSLRVYPGAGHAFFNDARPEAYHEASARDAWRRTLDFFAAHLR